LANYLGPEGDTMIRRVLLGLLMTTVVLVCFGCKAKAEVKTPEPTPAPPPPAPAPPPPLPEYITISDRIEFETDSDVLLPKSYPILDEVVKVMKDNPHIKLVEIQGHTDSDGEDGKNLLLSENRAKSCKAYIVSRGIEEKRMHPRGFGETAPVVSNDTEEGKQKNRRVEFRIVKQPEGS
jgi:outer membrane protein OmpA-like peptidoglycan-associated protein